MATYRLSRLAQADADNITEYTINRFGMRQSEVYDADIRRAAQFIADLPSIGRPYMTKKGRVYQRYSVGSHVLFYRPTEDGVFIVRILHQAMDFDRHLGG